MSDLDTLVFIERRNARYSENNYIIVKEIYL